ncbi:L-ascorbate metabolism protein UlaG (beta-lactamase superfamily) [Comamonas sp. BIGb0124]|uniref:MBL fold metallo-hydrolase n=1 Tax=Comamonas sp. BIGb0124 TaxID=2485130 RepID=UPI000F4AB11D|nr:MBL fold metallo-hydrolase [Comamonas sp. BIGb0124]ROR22824.1 L-ascorbate metabolism protein UlaG (beta-lactamase superfamily) [Comamonas sp. BIGb0124]
MRLPFRAWFVALLAGFATTGCLSASRCEPGFSASPQFGDDCRFHNTPNPDAKPSQGGLMNWAKFLLGSKVGTEPIDRIPMRMLDRAQLDLLDPETTHVVRLGHSSHLLKLNGKYWLIDPVFSERASPVQWAGPKRFHPTPIPLADLPPVEGVILSHDHYDHLDLATVRALREQVQRFFVPLGVGGRLRQAGVAPEKIQEFDWWQEGELHGVKVTATPAQHFSGRTLWDRGTTLWASWVIESGGERIFYSGDTGYFPGFKQIGERFGGFDLAMVENGAYNENWSSVHMTPEESVRAFMDLRGRVMYPVHNSTFSLALHAWQEPMERLTTLAMENNITLATPEIGEVLTVGSDRSNALWWRGLR